MAIKTQLSNYKSAFINVAERIITQESSVKKMLTRNFRDRMTNQLLSSRLRKHGRVQRFRNSLLQYPKLIQYESKLML